MFRARISKSTSVCTKPIVNRFVVSGMFAPIMLNLVRGLVLSLRSCFAFIFLTRNTPPIVLFRQNRGRVHTRFYSQVSAGNYTCNLEDRTIYYFYFVAP